MQNLITFIQQIVFIDNDTPKTDSLKIAEIYGKRHSDVIRKIENLDCSLEFNQRNFASVAYLDAKGEYRKYYTMTRDGFTFLVAKFSGKKAAHFLEQFISAFNEMAQELDRLHNTLIKRYERAQLQYNHISNEVSHAGYVLCVGGKQVKPAIKLKLVELEARIQHSLPFSEVQHERSR